MTNEFDNRAPQPNGIPKQKRGSYKQQPQTPEPSAPEKPIRWVQVRLIPIWLRIILAALLFLFVAAAGLTIGYSSIGDGDAGDALKWSTFQHILDIVSGKE